LGDRSHRPHLSQLALGLMTFPDQHSPMSRGTHRLVSLLASGKVHLSPCHCHQLGRSALVANYSSEHRGNVHTLAITEQARPSDVLYFADFRPRVVFSPPDILMTATSWGAPEHWPASPFESFRLYTPDMGLPRTALTSRDACDRHFLGCPRVLAAYPRRAHAPSHTRLCSTRPRRRLSGLVQPCKALGIRLAVLRDAQGTAARSVGKRAWGLPIRFAVHGDGVGNNS